MKALIFNIQRYSIHDGPGIRTTIFFKGCPLKCFWCSNPESQSYYPELAHVDVLCNRCGKCVELCKNQAIALVDNKILINRKLCIGCGDCVAVCYPEALKLFGLTTTVEEVFSEAARDQPFYHHSEGGITASGGEPLSQSAFVYELFKKCQSYGIHTCLDTSGYAPTKVLKRVLEHTDLVYYDIKHMDSIKHKQGTGFGNNLILNNARLIVKLGVSLVIRIPVIPGFNESIENITRTAVYLTELGIDNIHEVTILPYHRFGTDKYAMLDRNCSRYNPVKSGHGTLDQISEALSHIHEIFTSYGIKYRLER